MEQIRGHCESQTPMSVRFHIPLKQFQWDDAATGRTGIEPTSRWEETPLRQRSSQTLSQSDKSRLEPERKGMGVAVRVP